MFNNSNLNPLQVIFKFIVFFIIGHNPWAENAIKNWNLFWKVLWNSIWVPFLDCRVNMPTRYKKDLKCRACQPAGRDPSSSQCIDTSQPASREPTSSQAANQPTSDEDQDHIELCSGYAELWRDLGPYNQRARVQFFMRVKVKRLKMQHKEMRQQHQQQKQQKKLKQQQKQQHNQ